LTDKRQSWPILSGDKKLADSVRHTTDKIGWFYCTTNKFSSRTWFWFRRESRPILLFVCHRL